MILEETKDDAGNVEDESFQVNIKKDSTKDIVAENVTPINREQAVFKEFPDILVSLDEFLGKLVEVHDMEPTTVMIEIIWNRWNLEYLKSQQKQKRTERFLAYDAAQSGGGSGSGGAADGSDPNGNNANTSP